MSKNRAGSEVGREAVWFMGMSVCAIWSWNGKLINEVIEKPLVCEVLVVGADLACML